MSHRPAPCPSAPAAQAPDLPPLRIGLLGLGTVGKGTLAVLRRNQQAIARRTGRHLVVTHVAARNVARAQALATEHTEVAQMNMRLALERRAESEQVMPGIRLVVG